MVGVQPYRRVANCKVIENSVLTMTSAGESVKVGSLFVTKLYVASNDFPQVEEFERKVFIQIPKP
jgi:hypothetical protein